jgi:hypothetical protein
MADGAAISSDATKKRVNVAFDSKAVKKKKQSGDLIQVPSTTVSGDKYTSLPPGFNLAGRPEQLKHRNGIKRAETKVESPYQSGNINTTSYWQFVIKSSKEEWIRFNPDSISVTVYGTYDNPNYEQGSNVPARMNAKIALNARQAKPFMYLDPSILGSSFAYKADVYINNQMVPTNSAIGSLFQHYIRCARVYHSKAKHYFATNTDISNLNIESSPTMKLATAAFDYNSITATRGTRIPIYLDGVFPFDRKNRTIESIDQVREQSLFFPPDTEIIVKLHIYRSKIEAIFHTTMDVNNYFSTEEESLPAPTGNVSLTFQDASLEYESVILEEIEHVKAMKEFQSGGEGNYDYDIVRGQHKALEAEQSTSQVVFYIPSMARIIYILYLPDWATFPQEHTRKPLSGWSRFPANATSINIHFAGASNLVTEKFENFGHNFKSNDEISKKIYYEYLKKNLIINCSFEELFPRASDTFSLIQGFVLDVKEQMSDKMEKLTIQHEFAHTPSPKKHQVVCISVHPNGRAICRSQGGFRWVWEFLTRE